MNKLLNHIRVKIIDFLIGKDLSVGVNLKFKNDGFIIENNKYYYFRNIEINNEGEM